MTKFSLIIALAIPTTAIAQQGVSELTCQSLLDGGSLEVCGTFPANFQPLSATCVVSVPGASSAGTTVGLWGSPDGIHFGAIADGGYAITTVVNGDGGVGTAVATTFAISPTDPFQSVEIVGTGTAVDGGAGALNCYVGVIQTQTLHDIRKLGAARPKDVSVGK